MYCIVGGAGPEDDRRGEHSVEGGQGAGGQARLILTCWALEGGETHCSRVCSPNLTLRVTLYYPFAYSLPAFTTDISKYLCIYFIIGAFDPQYIEQQLVNLPLPHSNQS